MGYTPDSGANKNWLQKLAEKIPGISGYQAKETRREVDKLFRETLADRIRNVKATLGAAVRDLTDGRRAQERCGRPRAGRRRLQYDVRHAPAVDRQWRRGERPRPPDVHVTGGK